MILGRHSSTGTLSQELVSQRAHHPTIRLDAEGRFATELRAGDWEVSRQADFGSASASERLRVPEGGVANLDLRFPALLLEGRVVDIDGRPVEGARVLAAKSSAHALSGVDGTFTLAVEAPGRFTLFARDRERTSATAAVVLGLDSEQTPDEIELVLDSSATEIPIRVTDRGGEPAAGALVFVETAQGTRLLTADSRGEVSWKPRPPEPVRWRAAVHAGGRWAFSAWRDFDRRDGLDLAATGSSRLRIEAEPGRTIAIEGPDGWDLSFLSTRLGLPAQVADDGILVLSGLPAGTYRVALDDHARTAWLGDGDEAEVDLRE